MHIRLRSDGASGGVPRGAASPRLEGIFARIVRARWLFVAVYALLVPPAALFALRVDQDNSLDRLIVPTDPDFLATRAFQAVFGAGEFALLVAETDEPYSPASVARVDAIEHALQRIPGVTPSSAISIFRRARPEFTASAEDAAAFQRFATGTDLLRRQGLVGEGFLAIALVVDVEGPANRRAALDAVSRAVADANPAPSPLREVTPLGLPFVDAYLDTTQRQAPRYFALFAIFVVTLCLALYRSPRTLLAFLATLAVCLVLCLGFIGATGGSFTLVSPMVPMTILVTVTATLVYLQSRFVERPADVPVDDHQVFALANKFVACTASIFASGVGFAALTISAIRPIREMGLWVAVGLAMAWLVVFTLFPSLQRILRTPTRQERKPAGAGFVRFAGWLPGFTHRWRWPLVLGALLLSAGGAAALFGVRGVLAPMRVLTDPVEYIGHDQPLYRDVKRLATVLPGMSLTEVWLRGPLGSISDPDVLTGLHRFQQRLEGDPEVRAAIGPTTILRLVRYLGGEGDAWPEDPAARDAAAAELEGMLSLEPLLQRFVQPHTLAQTHITVISAATEAEAYRRLDAAIARTWQESRAESPALGVLTLATVGLGPLHAKMAQSLVPTLVESFALTATVIFLTFLAVFRSATARLLAMIPSLFAILVMFGLMRLAGMPLNVATILIASTVLGTSENDQIHFFYHFQEGQRGGSVEAALGHTLRIAGRAIVFATLINAGGFLAFALSDLPPLRQFGSLAAVAFALSMLADFTALPAALWILSRERPASLSAAGVPAGQGALPQRAPDASSRSSSSS
jgi:predicted RND superfamily exporter protein